jgi:hypothetical protein
MVMGFVIDQQMDGLLKMTNDVLAKLKKEVR